MWYANLQWNGRGVSYASLSRCKLGVVRDCVLVLIGETSHRILTVLYLSLHWYGVRVPYPGPMQTRSEDVWSV